MHDTSAILDAAARLLAGGGTAAVTMAAVIRESGAPSGSVYHRFADRPSLMAALWNRAVENLHCGAYALFDNDDLLAAAADVARHTVVWCRGNPLDAQILLAGARSFAPQDWPEVARAHRATEADRWDAAVRGLVRGLRTATGLSATAVVLAVIDLPYAAVRRYLSSGQPIPAELDEQVPAMVRTLLACLPSVEAPAADRR